MLQITVVLKEQISDIMGRKFHHKHYSCPEGMGYCAKCDKYRPFDEFGNNKDGVNGKHRWCKQCMKIYGQKNRIKKALYMKRFNYGISAHEYLGLLEAQGGVCAICGNPETKIHKGAPILLSVDHNHETGEIRGLLCSACNMGLGSFRDDRDLLQKAADYLHETDEERTQNPRISKDLSLTQVDEEVKELTREVKGLPKQLSGSVSDLEGLPLFSVQS